MFLVAHVNEVVDDDPAQVAEPQLSGDLPGRLQIHLVSRFLGIIIGAEIAAVDVDGDQGLGLIDDDGAAVG